MVRYTPALFLLACSEVSAPSADPAAMLQDVGACAEGAILDLVNSPETTADTLKAIDLHTRAANNLIETRNGADGVPGTADDHVFTDLEAVDAVPQVGTVAMETLLAYGDVACAGETPDTCPTDRALDFVNDPVTSADDLKDVGVYSRGADNLVALRDGPDGVPGTSDDAPFDSMEAVDDVSYVGDSSMAALDAYGTEVCSAELITSPTWYSESHLIRVQEHLAAATDSVDIAMYSLSDYATLQAVIDTAERGVSVRLVLDSARDDVDDPAGSWSADLEDAGVDVRYVNKIMHHKFAIVDGPRSSLDDAATATLITSSANWSYSGATKHDENTAFLTGDERLNLLYQREFNLLWDNSRDLVWNTSLVPADHIAIPDQAIADAEGSDALFTTDNFRTYVSSTYGPTFARDTDTWNVAEELAALISTAQSSVRIASGHFRAKPIYDAALAKAAEGVDVLVYVDGQEYASDWYVGEQLDDYDACMADAVDAGDIADCNEQGIHYANLLADADVPVRFKYYAYRWDYSYAPQMHNKYLIVDEHTLATGSYNYSPNAEFDTVENVAVLSADRYPNLVASYVRSFDAIYETGSDLYAPLLDEVLFGTDPSFDIVFEPMALERSEVLDLKDAIAANCPDIDSDAFRTDPAAHQSCDR